MYVQLDKSIIDRGTRIAVTLNEMRVAEHPYMVTQFPLFTLPTMKTLITYVKAYWKSYTEQTAPNGIGVARLADGARQTLSAMVPIVNFLTWKDQKHGVVPLAFWLRKALSPVQGEAPLSRDERLFVAEIRHLLNLMAELSALSLAQATDWTDTPSNHEIDERRKLTQVAERTAEQAIILLSSSGLAPNPDFNQWNMRLIQARKEQGLNLLGFHDNDSYLSAKPGSVATGTDDPS
jgi:hypothetical protein